MRPGQLDPNEFERAILEHFSRKCQALRPLIAHLRVLSREFTGVGSFTNFQCGAAARELEPQQIKLNSLISMPKVQNGMGAILFCEKDQSIRLEIFTFGDDYWDGVYEGFSISQIA